MRPKQEVYMFEYGSGGIVDIVAASEEEAREELAQMQHAKLYGKMEYRLPRKGLLVRFQNWLYKVLVYEL